jgi:hypothetical protein
VKLGMALRIVRGRSIIRDTQRAHHRGHAHRRRRRARHGFYGLDKEHRDVDERGEVPPGTYFGPLINLVVKNFDANAEGGRLVFHTIVPTQVPARSIWRSSGRSRPRFAAPVTTSRPCGT